MDGFLIMCGLVILGLAIDNGLNNIARAFNRIADRMPNGE